MELNDLRIFKTIAEEGSLSRAAVRLHYVQSNVSARLRQLEIRLGVPLVFRKARGVTLTPMGQVLLDYAKRILNLADEAVRIVQERDTPTGTLTIGSMETVAVVHLPAILSEYQKLCPQVDLQLVTGTSQHVLSYLLDHRVDAVFAGGAIVHPDLVGEVILEEELVLACAKGQKPFSNKERHNILVFRKGCAFRERLENWLRETGIFPYRVMEFNSVESIISCVLAGMGITFLPRSAFKIGAHDQTIDLYPLPADVAIMPVNFVSRRDTAKSKAFRAFDDLVHRMLKKSNQRVELNGRGMLFSQKKLPSKSYLTGLKSKKETVLRK